MRPFLAIVALLASAAAAAAQLAPTPAQTEGPYYPNRVKPTETDHDLTRIGTGPAAKGDAFRLDGSVVDTAGKPLAGARVEIWQTDSQGIYLHPGDPNTAKRDPAFQFFGVVISDAAGTFSFKTIVPARYPGRARHIHAKITPAGGPTLTTQFYFKADDDLTRDGIARRLGAALADVTLDPQPVVDGSKRATVRVVLKASNR